MRLAFSVMVAIAVLLPAQLASASPVGPYAYFQVPNDPPDSGPDPIHHPTAIGGSGYYSTTRGGFGATYYRIQTLWRDSVYVAWGYNGAFTAINDHGVAVGYEGEEYGSAFYALVVENGSLRHLNTGHRIEVPYGVNDSGAIVGFVQDWGEDPEEYGPKPYEWQSQEHGELSTGRHTLGSADDINHAGTIVGRLADKGDWLRFPSTGEAAIWLNGEVHELGKTSWTEVAINDSNWVLGNEMVGATGNTSSRPFLWKDGSFSELSNYGQTASAVAYDLNNRGEIVGAAAGLATLWVDGQIYDLNGLTQALPDSVMLRSAVGINEAGQILVDVFDSAAGQSATAVLTPVPEPATWAMLGLGLVALALRTGFRRPIRCAA